MASVCAVTLTPGRKRRASCLDLEPLPVLLKVVAITTTPSTPGVHDVPELDWAESPRSRETSPQTPPPISVCNEDLLSGVKPHCSDILARKRFRRSDQLRIRESSETIFFARSRSATPDAEKRAGGPPLLFPYSIYPLIPPLRSETPRLVGGDISEKNFKFFHLSRFPGESLRSRTTITPVAQNVVRRRSIYTEENNAESRISQRENIHHYTSIDNAPQAVTEEPKAPKSRRSILNPNFLARGFISVKLLEILPANMFERISDDSTRCVASYVTKPDERCGQKLKFCGDLKAWLTTQVLRPDSPLDITSSQQFITKLTENLTCTKTHRRVSKGRVEKLFEYIDCQKKIYPTKHCDFSHSDFEGAQTWLKAITSLPEMTNSNLLELPLSPTDFPENSLYTSSETSVFAGTVRNLDSRTKNDDTTSRTIFENRSSDQQSSSPVKKLNLKPMGEGRFLKRLDMEKSIKVTKALEISPETPRHKSDATIFATKTVEVVQKTEKTQAITRDGPGAVPNEAVVVEKSSDLVKTVETTKHSVGDTKYVKKVTTTVTAQQKQKISTFQPLSTDEINFAPTQTTTVKLRRSARIAARESSRPSEEQLTTIHQKFSWSKKASRLSVKAHLKSCIRRPLTKREYDCKSQSLNYPGQGLIYMYWIPGNFGFVKIGKTSGKSTAARLASWKKQCGHDVEEHTRGEQGTALQIPHAFRVEALIHAELKEYRMVEASCEKCGKSHEEWFAVSPSHAQRVIQKWSDWILTRPYECVDGVWRLKISITTEQIDALCTPIEVPVGHLAVLPAFLKQNSSSAETPVKRKKKGKERRKSSGL